MLLFSVIPSLNLVNNFSHAKFVCFKKMIFFPFPESGEAEKVVESDSDDDSESFGELQ